MTQVSDELLSESQVKGDISGRLKAALKERANAPQGLTRSLDSTKEGLAVNATRTCSVPDCARPIRSGGLCFGHRREAINRGTFRDLRRAENRPALPEVPCRVDDCTSTSVEYRGLRLCMKHYLRLWKNGTLDLPTRKTLGELLEDGIADRAECWTWGGAVSTSGYGRLGDRYAHRVAYELHSGPIARGLQIDHLCGNTLCVRPDHLEAVSQAENLRRQQLKMQRRTDGTWTKRRDGKCRNCVEQTLDANDQWVPCQCPNHEG